MQNCIKIAGVFATVAVLVIFCLALMFVDRATEVRWLSMLITIAFLFVAVCLVVGFALAAPSFARAFVSLRESSLVAAAFTALVFLFYCLLFAAAFMSSQGAGGAVCVSRPNGPPIASMLEFFYFAIVTGTTTGYGDLYPTGLARLVACFQIILIPVVIGAIVENFRSTRGEQIRAQEAAQAP